MPVLLMTDRSVAGLRSTTRQTHFDQNVRGLALRVGAKTRTWYFTYRNGGPTEWLRLGDYPALGLAAARTAAKTARRQLDHGTDPAVERRTPPPLPEPVPEPPRAYTFGDFMPTFVQLQRQQNVRGWRSNQGQIERHLIPEWRDRPLDAIKRKDVQEMLDRVTAKGLTGGVNRLQALISRIFTLALDQGKVEAHPAARIIKRFADNPRDRVLSDDEIRALWAALEARPGPASDAIKLRLLLGQRGGETAYIQWSEVDLEAALWTIPRARTKNRKAAHPVPLPATALRLLTARRKAAPANEPHVFAGLSLSGDEHRELGAIHHGTYEWKDLRRTVATRLADLGVEEALIGRVLNHAKYTITAKHYNKHAYVDEMRDALVRWDAELHRILTKKPKARSRVLSMRSR